VKKPCEYRQTVEENGRYRDTTNHGLLYNII
jgi:hypothetical protein